MNKPFGVMASAVFALLGSLLMLAFCVLASLVLILPAGRSPMPPEAKLGLVFGIAFFGILGAWGTTTAIGLFRVRNWGRISMIVFATLLALTGLVAAPVIMFIPALPSAPPNYDVVRNVIAVCYAVFGLLGGLWLYYFSRRATRDAFGGTIQGEAGGRPLSISIIGWWLLIAGVIGVLASPLRMPAALFFWVISGWTAAMWNVAFGGLFAYVGYGLLRLNPLARKIAIVLMVFGGINGVVFWLTPGRDARFAVLISRFHFGPQPPPLVHFPMFMLIPVGAGIAVPLWFLIARKEAFHEQLPGPMSEAG
jgi:hypothetical protein